MYQGFAEIYDELMDDVDYEAWADYYCRLLSIYGIRGGKICECACGTGSLTLPLYRRGFQMTGVDLSREMLWQAAQKSRKQGIAIPYVQQDMKALNLHRPMDAVLATCDGVNYLLTEEDLLSFFRAAHRSVRPGGALIFDVSTPHKLRDVLCAQLLWEDRENITYLWTNTWHEKKPDGEPGSLLFPAGAGRPVPPDGGASEAAGLGHADPEDAALEGRLPRRVLLRGSLPERRRGQQSALARGRLPAAG